MNRAIALAALIGAFGLGGCATVEVDNKTGNTAKAQKDASPKEERETVTGSRLPRRES